MTNKEEENDAAPSLRGLPREAGRGPVQLTNSNRLLPTADAAARWPALTSGDL